MAFQRDELVRQCRLGQVQTGGSTGQAAGFIQRLDYAQMFKCQHVLV
ncbi:hypothetical protein SFMTTN_1741 [Sulfuriferula multivorans]|uniref:Uncharacterized protein n=1 Tax=Sulfuriferula multivorans TaxID=1559896 RepID=A0A401JE95_9PROT|nr:hypothetical protein SFMTTN_1741 [Sulfuriferula multivorans]